MKIIKTLRRCLGLSPAPQFIRRSESCYWVRNQRGFNAALYDYFGAVNGHGDGSHHFCYTKKSVRQMVQNWPKSYPATIIIRSQAFECGRVYIEFL